MTEDQKGDEDEDEDEDGEKKDKESWQKSPYASVFVFPSLPLNDVTLPIEEISFSGRVLCRISSHI